MELSIIFVNWNSTGYLRECIESILEYTSGFDFEIVIVDNASPVRDVGSLAATLKSSFGRIVLIESPVNLGFAGANNAGFLRSTGEYVLFLNPDTRLIGPAICQMLKTARSLPGAGILGCRLLNTDLSVQTSCIQTFPTILNQTLDTDYLRGRWPRSRIWGTAPLFAGSAVPARVEVVSGACMLMKRSVFTAAGMFSEAYFMYAEDVDLCRQVKQAGFENYFAGDISLIHHGGKSSTPEKATVAKWRATLQYFVRNHGYPYALLFRAVMSLVAIVRLGLLTLGSDAREAAPHALPIPAPVWSASLKWRAILLTLLTFSGLERATPKPDGAPRGPMPSAG